MKTIISIPLYFIFIAARFLQSVNAQEPCILNLGSLKTDSCFAGDTIKAISIRSDCVPCNQNNFCYTLKGPGVAPNFAPKILTGQGCFPVVLDDSLHEIPSSLCTHGVDTIKLILYHASISLDSLFYSLKLFRGTTDLNPISIDIPLFASSLHSLKIESPSGNPLKDTIFVNYLGGGVVFDACGFDSFGNAKGKTNAKWKGTGTIIVDSTVRSSCYLENDSIMVKSGYVKVYSPQNSSIRDSVYVVLQGTTRTINNQSVLKSLTQNLKTRYQDLLGRRIFLSNQSGFIVSEKKKRLIFFGEK